MRVAALDLGTNTFLCLIAEGDKTGIRAVLRDEVEIVRLGQAVDRTGEFHQDALARAHACLTKFRKMIAETGGVDRVLAVATSAARDVRNGHELLRMGDELNIPMTVISGDDEARFSYAGACSSFADAKHRLVVDIGGGSTELILGRGRELLFARSVDIGAVRLTERFIKGQPVSREDRLRLEAHIREELQAPLQEIGRHPLDEILAVAGTPTSIVAAELGGFDPAKVDGYALTLPNLQRWADEFASTTVEQKKEKYRLGGRADIIFAGTSILAEVVAGLGRQSTTVSVKGLRYGVALDLLARG